MKNYVLVDTDNIYIIDHKIKKILLKKRLEIIKQLDGIKIYFGNKKTEQVMKSIKFDDKLRVTETEEDSADHQLIQTLRKILSKVDTKGHFTIVTNDQTLVRLLVYFVDKKDIKIKFLSFENESLILIEKYKNELIFKSSNDLTKFMRSLLLLVQRFR